MSAAVDTAPPAALYLARVMHARLSPFKHRFTYRVFSLYLDIDRIEETVKSTRLLSYNRFNVLSFHDKDHGKRDGSPLRSWVEEILASAGVNLRGGQINLLCFPRIFGYVFNPLSAYYCFNADGLLSAMLYQVHNTFGGCHAYVVPVGNDAGSQEEGQRVFRQRAEKVFYVSPFIGMEATYWFTVRPPSQTLRLAIRQTGPEAPVLLATYNGYRRALNDRSLAWAMLTHPLMTLKVSAAINWEALKIWFKGGRFHWDAPDPPAPHTRGDSIPPKE